MKREIKMSFPHVFSAHVKEDGKEVDTIDNISIRGVLGADGKWLISCGFLADKLDVGKYRVSHGWGYENTSISITILIPPGTIEILEHHPNYFVVQTKENGEPKDKDFAFTMVKVI